MNRRHLRAPLLLSLALVISVAACSERLETSSSCPLLCPGQEMDIRDTVIDPAIVFDTTLGVFPLQGFETSLLLATRGDTLDVRPIVRFDLLPRTFTPPGDTARAVTSVDSAFLRVQLRVTTLKTPSTFFIDAFDVGDTTLVDSIPSTLLPLFTPARLLGSLAVDSATVVDSGTVLIPIDTSQLRAILGEEEAVLRIGLRLRGTESGALLITASDDVANGPSIQYRVSADTAVPLQRFRTSSKTPRFPPGLDGDLPDYVVVARAPDLRAPARFAAGGMPSVRSYLRFELPFWIADSTAVLSARLELVQDPIRGLDDSIPVTVYGQMVIAGHSMTSLERAARLLAPVGFFVTDSVRRAPADSGTVFLEMNALVRQWRSVNGVRQLPNALVLSSALEGTSGLGIRFFGVGAAPGLRPRLRVSYVPSIVFGRP